jgi:hypothetical protein
MKPVDMTTVHNPPESIGDCFRCCIASILELPADQVPHVYEGEGWFDETGRVGMKRLRDWLATIGFYYFEFELPADKVDEWVDGFDCHYIISGMGARGVRHVCVGFSGKIVHDPHPSRSGIEPDNGKFLLGLICKR